MARNVMNYISLKHTARSSGVVTHQAILNNSGIPFPVISRILASTLSTPKITRNCSFITLTCKNSQNHTYNKSYLLWGHLSDLSGKHHNYMCGFSSGISVIYPQEITWLTYEYMNVCTKWKYSYNGSKINIC